MAPEGPVVAEAVQPERNFATMSTGKFDASPPSPTDPSFAMASLVSDSVRPSSASVAFSSTFPLGPSGSNVYSKLVGTLPDISCLSHVKLQWKDGTHWKELLAPGLWKSQSTVIVMLRRPGCILCRYQVRELWLELKKPLERIGVDMVCVVHEWIDREINAFAAYWPGKIYLDTDKELFKVLGGGALLRLNVWSLFNPFNGVWRRIWKARQVVKGWYNLRGTGSIMGGLMVVKQGKGSKAALTYMHVEKELGLPAPHDQVLEAAMEAAGVDIMPLPVLLDSDGSEGDAPPQIPDNTSVSP